MDEYPGFDPYADLGGLPEFVELFPAQLDGPTEDRLPALPPALRQEIAASRRDLAAAAAGAALATGDGFRAVGTQLGVDGPHRILSCETSFLGPRDQLARAVYADARNLADLTADTTPAPVWETLGTLFNIWARRLRILGERDQVLVVDLDLRRSGARSVHARLDELGRPVGTQGQWTAVLRPREGLTGPEIAVMDGSDHDRVVSRLERLLVRYGVQFRYWPGADVAGVVPRQLCACDPDLGELAEIGPGDDSMPVVPDSLDGVPGFVDLFPYVTDPRPAVECLPALPADLRDAIDAALLTLAVAAQRAVNALGNATRCVATELGVTGAERLMTAEASFDGGRPRLARMVFADADRMVALTADTASSGLWRTVCVLFELVRRLRALSEHAQVLVWDVDRRLFASRVLRARLGEDLQPVGEQGVWTAVVRPNEALIAGELFAVTDGPVFVVAVERMEELIRAYGVRFTEWPDADIPR